MIHLLTMLAVLAGWPLSSKIIAKDHKLSYPPKKWM